MRFLIAALVYTAALTGANAQVLTDAQRAEAESLRSGDMRKLAIHAEPVAAPDIVFTHRDGSPATLADTNGVLRLVNFWATWCAPCRREKPSLEAVQTELAPEGLQVLPIATGRNTPEAIDAFKAEVGLVSLDTDLDPRGTLAAAMGVPGLPVTVILNREGAEIGRLMGGADWNSPSAKAILRYLLALP